MHASSAPAKASVSAPSLLRISPQYGSGRSPFCAFSVALSRQFSTGGPVRALTGACKVIPFSRRCSGKTPKRGLAEITTATRPGILALSWLPFPLFKCVVRFDSPFFGQAAVGNVNCSLRIETPENDAFSFLITLTLLGIIK